MAAPLIPLLLLAACEKEQPDFEARYDQAAKEIEARAKAMDADIAAADQADAPPQDLPPAKGPSKALASSGE